jgi:hypothetical protein
MKSGSTLTSWLRARSDEQLADLLLGRPDLGAPVPAGLNMLAARAGVRVSVARAMERLTAYELELLQLICLLPEPVAQRDVLRLAGDDAAEALERLRTRALIWGDDELRPVHAVRDLLGPHLLGLGRALDAVLARHGLAQLAPILEAHGLPPAADRHAAGEALQQLFGTVTTLPFRPPETLTAALAAVSEEARDLVGRLAQGPPLGATGEALRTVRKADARSPVEELLARGLLVGVDVGTVELPREVGLAVRGNEPLGTLHSEPPELRTKPVRSADATAALAAYTAVRLTTDLLQDWGATPPAMLRAGGLGIRDLRSTARLLDVTEPVAAVLVEVTYAAGLLDIGPIAEPHATPTSAFDGWRELPLADRWFRLIAAWLRTERVPALVGSKDETGSRTIAALTATLERPGTAELRRALLAETARAPAGTALTSDSLRERLGWRLPWRGGRLRDLLVEATVTEADLLGITGAGALSAAGRALLDSEGSDQDAVVAAVEPYLPVPVDTVVIQADLTALAAGPLVPDLDREMAVLADVESPGAATVYRFTEAGIRRALDAGRTADDLHALLHRISKGPVPQTLDYLVDDVARRHGVLRAGGATSYLRCDDPALLSEVAAARGTGELRLRRLAPTVLISRASVARVLEVLRAAGYAPVAESPEGMVVLSRPDEHRLPPRTRPTRVDAPGLPPDKVEAAVRSLRRADEATRDGKPMLTTAAEIIAAVQEAVLTGGRLRIGYVNASGATSDRIVAPISVGGGYFTAYDEQSDERRTFSIARVTGLAAVPED